MEQEQIQFNKTKITSASTIVQKGFTLLEVLVAVLILALSYVAVLQIFSTSLKSIDKIISARKFLFEELLAISEHIRFAGVNPLEDETDEEAGVLFIDGEKYRLLIVRSSSGALVTLKLQSNL